MAFTVTERHAWSGTGVAAGTTHATASFAATGGGELIVVALCASDSSVAFSSATFTGHGGTWSTFENRSFQSADPSFNFSVGRSTDYTTGAAAVTATWGTSSTIRAIYALEITAGGAITFVTAQDFGSAAAGTAVFGPMTAGVGNLAMQFCCSVGGAATLAPLAHFASGSGGTEIEDATDADSILNLEVAYRTGLIACPTVGGLQSASLNWAAIGAVWYEGSAPSAPVRMKLVGARVTSGTTSTTLPDPGTSVSGDLAIAARVIKPDTATATDTSGFTEIMDVTGGTGTTGVDVGQTRLQIEYDELAGDIGTTATAQASTPNSVTGNVVVFEKDSGTWDVSDFGSHNKTTHNAARTASTASSTEDIALAPGDVVVCWCATDTDATTVITAATITAPSITFGVTQEKINPGGAGTGNDCGLWIYSAVVESGTATGQVTLTLTGGPSNCGRTGILRVRATGGDQTLTGALATETDTGHVGTIGTDFVLDGVLATATNTAFAGDITVASPEVTITGDLALEADTAFAGTINVDQALVGVLATETDTAHAGTITVAAGIFTDNFNRADSDSLGSDWIEAQGTFAIASNAVSKTDGAEPPGFLIVNRDFGPDHWIEATLAVSNGSGNVGLFGRIASSNLTGWSFEVADGNFAQINAVDGEAAGTEQTGASHTHATGEKYRLECDGNNLTFYLNGTSVLSDTTTTYNTNQRVGLHWHENSAGAVKWDNVRAGPMPYVSDDGPQAFNGELATETDTAFAGAILVEPLVAGVLATETDTAFAGTIAVDQTLTGVLATETDTGHIGDITVSTAAITIVGELAVETDTAFAGSIAPDQVLAGVLASETDSAFAGTIARDAVLTGVLATETDSAFAGTVLTAQVLTGALATETDTGHVGTILTPPRLFGLLATETDTALVGTIASTTTLTAASAEQMAIAAEWVTSSLDPVGIHSLDAVPLVLEHTGRALDDSDTGG